ncbi:hemerythrin domain-containing protein [Pseudogracilibacillus auburnensis]|uniref:Hemerythrin HHE cation binding domain-containing protein n=1 Tax=Pseudogracilibacillus auburnensis TaxID=1494959 RepID=A0A2V3VVE8_9BACI|nr:hemerythrin domain-containing protein [Pseudogracilibacillus auburnensis]PXW85636.1 hemerythrin HHE cation binding domain-containing protein [Pseudogracilibacillus auburnensis]
MKKHTEFTFNLPALRIMENEHHLLRYLMADWHPIVLSFERNAYTIEQGYQAIQLLRTKMMEFLDPFQNHLKKEEEYLFPLLSQYVGNEQGPVLAVEEEHKEIEAYIGHFLHHTNGDVKELSLQQMKDIVRDVGEAFEVITFHFVKEESVIFPMVKEILSPTEQYTLFEKLYSSII